MYVYRVFVLSFHAPLCPLSVFYILPSVCNFVPSMHSPRYLTCWSSSPVPRLVIVFVYLVSVFPALLVRSLSLYASPHVSVHACFQSPHGMCFLQF